MIKNNVLDAKKLLDYLKINKPSHFSASQPIKLQIPLMSWEDQKK